MNWDLGTRGEDWLVCSCWSGVHLLDLVLSSSVWVQGGPGYNSHETASLRLKVGSRLQVNNCVRVKVKMTMTNFPIR